VVLAAGVKAAADFDAQVLHRLIQLQALFTEAITQLARETARGSDAQFAGVGAGAGGNVDDGGRVRRTQTDRPNGTVKLRKIRLAQPAEENILLYRGAERVLNKSPREVGERAQLLGAGVAERQGHGSGHISPLPLLVNVGSVPGLESLRPLAAVQAHSSLERFFHLLIDRGEMGRPARIRRKLLPLFEY